jgi:hypothetical protein
LLVVSLAVRAWAQPADGGALGPARVIDRVVASVDGRVITLSQLEFETRVHLITRGGAAAAFRPLDDDDRRAGLTQSITERLATLEADRFEAYQLEPGELEQAIADFTARLGSEGLLREFLVAQDADVADVGAVLRRSLRAGRALDGRLRLKATVTESEVKRAQADVVALRSLPADVVRQRLVKERFEKLVAQELAAVRRNTDVRVLVSFARPDAGEP